MLARVTGRQWLGAALVVAGLGLLALGLLNLMSAGQGAPSPSATASAFVAASESTPPAPSDTPVPTPTPLGEEAVRAFVAQLVAAIQAGDTDTLYALLHPATIERYGEAACRAKLSEFVDPTFEIQVDAISPQAAWEYVADGLTTTIPNAWTVSAMRTRGGVTEAATLHFAPSDGSVRWFTDCGEPL